MALSGGLTTITGLGVTGTGSNASDSVRTRATRYGPIEARGAGMHASWKTLQLSRWVTFLVLVTGLWGAARAHAVVWTSALAVVLLAADILIVRFLNREKPAGRPTGWVRFGVPILALVVGVLLVLLVNQLIVGVAVTVFAWGQTVAEFRDADAPSTSRPSVLRRMWRLRAALLFSVAVLVLCFGMQAIRASGSVAVAVGVVVLLVALTQLSVASGTEDVRERFSATDIKLPIVGVVLTGGLLTVLAVCLFRSATGSWLSALVAVTILIVLVVIVGVRSNTDVISVVIFVAVVLSVPPTDASRPSVMNVTSGQRVIVALGDSYISGEGAAHFLSGTDDENKNACRRADTAWPVGLAERAGESPLAPPTASHDGLVFLGCSGARATNVSEKGHAQYEGEPVGNSTRSGETQLTQATRTITTKSLQVDAVFVSIGGNDASFSTIGKTCLGPGTCTALGAQWLRALYHDVRPSLVKLYAEIKTDLAGKGVGGETPPVIVVPYPIPIEPVQAKTPCSGFSPFSAAEQDFLNKYTTALDAVEKYAAAKSGVLFMETMEQAFADGSWICGGKSAKAVNLFNVTTVNGAPDRSVNPGRWVHGSFHPNAFGHSKMLAAAVQWLAQNSSQLHNPEPQTAPTQPKPVQMSDIAGKDYGACNGKAAQAGKSLCTTSPTQWLLESTGSVLSSASVFFAVSIGTLGTWLLFLAAYTAARKPR